MDLKRIIKTQKNGFRIFRDFMNKKTIGEKFIEKELMELLTFHPEAEEKGVSCVSDIDYMVVRPHALFKSPCLYYKSGLKDEEHDISVKKCIRSLFGNYTKPSDNYKLCRALRGAIADGTRLEFFEKYKNNKCETCDNVSDSVDHYPLTFKKIVEGFGFGKVEVMYNGYDYELKPPLKQKWKDYHDKQASYRMLCRSCNSKFGDYC